MKGIQHSAGAIKSIINIGLGNIMPAPYICLNHIYIYIYNHIYIYIYIYMVNFKCLFCYIDKNLDFCQEVYRPWMQLKLDC